MKKDANTHCIPLYITPMYDCREGHGVIIGNTQCWHLILVSVLFSPVIPVSYLQNVFFTICVMCV